jgi:hypothetical protein
MFVPPRYSEEEARAAIAASRSWSQSLRRLGVRPAGGNGQTLQKYARTIWLIPTDHFDGDGPRRVGRPSFRPLSEVLVEGSTYSRANLKRRLFAEGLKERRCELCGQDELWQGRRMSLILDHINGIADDNRLANLQIVCANCAATLDTHCGRLNRLHHEPRSCEYCGSEYWPNRHEQRFCSRKCGSGHPRKFRPYPQRRKVTRPPYTHLLREVRAMGFLATGRRYGVSDNAIRKWLRSYEREIAQHSEADRQRDEAA